jgi:hypothetical protein
LGLKDNKTGKRRFHFEAFWPRLDGFLEGVWNSVQEKSCPFLTLELKLKGTAKGFRAWSDKVGNVESQLSLAREILHQFEIAQDGRPLTTDESTLKNRLKKHSLALASLKQTIARLRSRIG